MIVVKILSSEISQTDNAHDQLITALRDRQTNEAGIPLHYAVTEICLSPECADIHKSVVGVERAVAHMPKERINEARRPERSAERDGRSEHGLPLPEGTPTVNQQLKDLFNTPDFPFFLYDDQETMLAILSAFAQHYENTGIIIFDARPATCLHLLNKRVLKKENILLAGVRRWQKGDPYLLREQKLKYYTMSEISTDGIADVCDAIMSVARDFGVLFVSINISVVDPAFAPGTCMPESGGLSSRELIYILQRLKKLKNFRAAGLTGIAPENDIRGMTVQLGAAIIAECGAQYINATTTP